MWGSRLGLSATGGELDFMGMRGKELTGIVELL